jgi:tagatose-1,6-bisphosphate aldolase non-catalytic subunit AgaZ/GatZ
MPEGIYSACTANPYALRAVLKRALDSGTVALVEATANQVNQDGGYTGMTPAVFRDYMLQLAGEVGLDRSRIILGGDHLGPLTWKDLPEEIAMERAEILVRCYVEAGFEKIHIDTSMRLGSDDPNAPFATETVANRGARLCRVAENAYEKLKARVPDAPAPLYVIGSEVPIPGGAQEKEESVHVTRPEDCIATAESFRNAFERSGLSDAWKRVIGIVVQPGVEFGNDQVFDYDRSAASKLTAAVSRFRWSLRATRPTTSRANRSAAWSRSWWMAWTIGSLRSAPMPYAENFILAAVASRFSCCSGVVTRAGMPTAVAPAGTSRTTTALEPTFAPSPTRIGPRILAPAPTTTLRPSVGCRLPLFQEVPPRVTP